MTYSCSLPTKKKKNIYRYSKEKETAGLKVFNLCIYTILYLFLSHKNIHCHYIKSP